MMSQKDRSLWLFSHWILPTLVLAGMLVLANFLLIAKTEQALKTTLRDSAMTSVEGLRSTVTDAYTLGLFPENVLEQQELQALTASNPRLLSIDWFDPSGQWVIGSGTSAVSASPNVQEIRALTSGTQVRDRQALQNRGAILWMVKSTFGQPIGVLALEYKTTELQNLRGDLISVSLDLFPWVMLAGSLALLIWSFAGHRTETKNSGYWRLTILSTMAMAVMALLMFRQTEPMTQPFVSERLNSIANAQQQLWSKAAEQGFALEDFENTEEYLNSLASDYPEIGQARLMSQDQLQAQGQIKISDEASILLEPNPNFLTKVQLDLGLDYLTLTLILFFFWAQFRKQTVEGLSTAANQTVNRIKPLLFVFFLSEELIRPFLPVFAANTEPALIPDLPVQWIPSLSISLFMVVVALSQPYLSRIRQFDQAGRFWLMGCVLSLAGLGLLFWSPNSEVLLLGRLLSGFGYAACFVSGQCMLLLVYGPEKRASAFASLVVCIMAATIVGPALGGLIADNLGQSFSVALAITASGCAALWSLFNQKESAARGAEDVQALSEHSIKATPQASDHELSAKGSTSGALAGLLHPKMIALTLFAAVPAKLMLTGLLFFLIPLMSSQGLGLSSTDVGRVILVYGLLMLWLSPLFARLSQQKAQNNTRLFVSLGLLVTSACGLIPLLSWLGLIPSLPMLWIALAVAATLGLGQSMAISSQASLVQILQSRYAPNAPQFSWLGTYRLVERLGNAMGPPLAAALLALFGPSQTLMVFGTIAAACALLVLVSLNIKDKNAQETSLSNSQVVAEGL